MQSYVGGQGFAAVFTVGLRAVTKAMLTDSRDGLRISAAIFFLSAAAICLACLLVQRCIIIPHPLFAERSDSDSEGSLIPGTPSDKESDLPENDGDSRFLEVVQKLKAAILPLLLFNVVTYTLFPGVISDVQVSSPFGRNSPAEWQPSQCDALGDWYGVMLVATFAVSDFLARLTPGAFVSTRESTVFVALLAMASLIPITFVAAHSFPDPYLISSLMSLLGITDG